jgi:hypothetical protein
MDDRFRLYGYIGGCYDSGGRSLGGYYFLEGGDRRIWSPLPRLSSDALCSRARLKDWLAGA